MLTLNCLKVSPLTESAQPQGLVVVCCLFFGFFFTQNSLLNSYSFLLFGCFSENLVNISRDIINPSFIFLIIFLSKYGLLTEIIFADKEAAVSAYNGQITVDLSCMSNSLPRLWVSRQLYACQYCTTVIVLGWHNLILSLSITKYFENNCLCPLEKVTTTCTSPRFGSVLLSSHGTEE